MPESDSLQRKRTTGLTDERMLLLASEGEGEPGIQLMYRLCKGTRTGITAVDVGICIIQKKGQGYSTQDVW